MVAELTKEIRKPSYDRPQRKEYVVKATKNQKVLGLDIGKNSIAWSQVQGTGDERQVWKSGIILFAHKIKESESDYNRFNQKRLNEIQKLEDDWDYEGGMKPLPENITAAKTFLKAYGEAIFHKNGVWLPIPEIEPVNNGSIDISWHTDRARILFNIRQVEIESFAFYYGDLYNNKLSIKGHVPVSTEVFSYILEWMKYLSL